MTVYDLKSGSETERIELPVSVALGNFDGLHRGHAELIRQAKCSEEKSCVFTFSSNPFGTPRIMTLRQKLDALREMGVDYAAICDFFEIRDMSARDFIEDILIARLNCVNAVCGPDFRFGKGASGDTGFLRLAMESRGYRCTVADKVLYNGEEISSSRIRSLLSTGDIKSANELLGREYAVDYHVSRGNRIGRSLGFPTVNQHYDGSNVKLPYGVYICSCMGYHAITNFGVRPTVTSADTPVYETYILGYNGDLYGEDIRVIFHEMIRPEKKFYTFEELSAQIALDVKKAEEYFK